MIWDFRVIKKMVLNRAIYEIHRVFYKDHTKKNIHMIDSIPSSIVGVEPMMMLEDLDLMTRAFDLPTLYIPDWNVPKGL